ncbi:hypothetical protein Tco_1397535, partial [Tanacetum coccineum]
KADNEENVSKHSNDPLLSGEDSLKLGELMALFKKLEKKGGSKTHKLKRLYKVGLSRRVESSEESLGKEDASKQGRKINDIDVDEGVILVDETQGRYGDNQMFDVSDLADEKVFVVEQGVPDSKKDDVVSTADAAQVSTTATTVTITPKDITLAQVLHELKTAQPKVKGIVFKEPVETTTTTTTISLQQPSQATIQDKGKGKMVEPKPVKEFSKKDQIGLDEELAFKLQAEEEEEERLAREKVIANVILIEEWNDIQAKIEADQLLAKRLQAREQEELTIEERTKLFQQLLEKRRKFFAAKSVEEKRNKPLTKAQKRSIMSTYLKNMAGYKHNQLKNKSFNDIQKLFDKEMKRVNTFVDMDTELVEGSKVRAEGSMTREEGSSKRAGDELKQESTLKQKIDKIDDDQEEAKMKELLDIIPDEEEVAIDVIPLATKPLTIVDYKIIKEGKISNFQIIRADRSSKRYSAFIQMLKSFNREDLETL